MMQAETRMEMRTKITKLKTFYKQFKIILRSRGYCTCNYKVYIRIYTRAHIYVDERAKKEREKRRGWRRKEKENRNRYGAVSTPSVCSANRVLCCATWCSIACHEVVVCCIQYMCSHVRDFFNGTDYLIFLDFL